MKKKPTVIFILGPTAVGKTALSIELAQELNAEIISCDSRQMYKNIDIGTAKPALHELATVPHHFIDFLDLEHNYSAGHFERDALKLISDSDKDYWVVVGGSGLYTKALAEGLDDVPRDLELRKKLNSELESKGIAHTQERLKTLDPRQYESMDHSNPQRLVRALEVCLITGVPYSLLKEKKPSPRPFHSLQVALRRERTELRERISERLEEMIKNGWMEEAESVYSFRKCNSLNTVGYKELFQVISGEMELEEAKGKIFTETARFAKRQMTWLRSQENIHWLDLPHPEPKEAILHLLNSLVQR